MPRPVGAGVADCQKKLGDRGVYLQGDLTRLPLRDGSVDAVTCKHVIYQIPPELQSAAFLELWRVLKPGGVAIIVYLWPKAPLAWRIAQLANVLVEQPPAPLSTGATAELPHHPQSLAWLKSQAWPFRFTLDTFRPISNAFLSHHISDSWRGRAFLNLLYAFQVAAPGFCARYGEFPVIIVRKPSP